MSKAKVAVLDNGPLVITGEFEIVDAEGNTYPEKPKVSLCRCGLSDNKPFCNGAHKGKFESQPRVPQDTE